MEIRDIFEKNWRILDLSSEQKEALNSCTEFFYFIKNEENFEIIDEIYKNIENNSDAIKIFIKEDKNFLITIIIFKSFLSYSPIYTSNFGEFKNSDKLLDYCVEMYTSYCVFNGVEEQTKRRIRGYFYICFYLLIKSNVVEEKKIKKEKFLSKFWKIKIKNKEIYKYENFKISYNPFRIKKVKDETYLIGLFFWNVYNIYSKNFCSDTKFNIKKEEYLDLLIKRYLYIDVSHFDMIKKLKNKNEDNLEQLNAQLTKIMKEENWSIESKKKIEEIQKKYSKKIEDQVLENFINTEFNEKDKIYFPFYFDFRGRKYYNSVIGPTQNRTLRFVYHYSWYNKEDFSNIIKIQKILDFEKKINCFCEKNKLEYSEIFLENYFWLLIGIGKFKIDKKEIEIKDEKIIDMGIKIIENIEIIENFDLEEKIEILHYIEIMKSLKTEKIEEIRKRVISKDGTASVYQISMILLKPKNQESFKWINLYNKNEWVDTYSYIIKKFKEDTKVKDECIEIFDRRTTKKVLMTIPYSIGKTNAYKYFIEEIEKMNIDYKKLKNLKKIHDKFYDYVKNDFEKKYLYEENTKNYIKKIMEKFLEIRNIYVSTETAETNLAYKKLEKKTMDLIFEMKINETIIRERIVKLIKKTSKSIDYHQTNISLGANLRHFYEADLLRITEIYLNYSINTIHDAELIDFNSCSKLILIKNRIYKEIFPEYEISSIFIII